LKPADFEKIVDGLSSDEVISAAIECGLLENKDISCGDVVMIPRWLAEVLIKRGIVEAVTA
jgi:hypothetical protein